MAGRMRPGMTAVLTALIGGAAGFEPTYRVAGVQSCCVTRYETPVCVLNEDSAVERKRLLQFRHELRLREINDVRKKAAAAARPLPFQTAREAVQLQGLRTQAEFARWFRNNRKALRQRFIRFYKDGPGYIPEQPDQVYAEWLGWDDFLGVLLPYEDAKLVAASLGVASQEEWWRFVRTNDRLLLSLRIPASPHIFYRDQWRGYDDWLGKPTTPLFFRRSQDPE
jgi:hypothetical protein